MADDSQKECVDELYDTVRSQLKCDGLMRDLRCRFQTSIIEMLHGKPEKGETLSGANAKGDPRSDVRFMLSNQLIMEYLHWFGYKFTAQMLSMESGEENKPPFRESLESLLGTMDCPELPILLEVVANMVSRQKQRIMKGTCALEQKEKCCDELQYAYMDVSCMSSRSVATKQYVAIRPRSSSLPPGNKAQNAAAAKKRLCLKRSAGVIDLRPIQVDTFSTGTESTAFCQSYYANDEEDTDNCSMEANFAPTPSVTSFGRSNQSSENIDSRGGDNFDEHFDSTQTEASNEVPSAEMIASKAESNSNEYEIDREPLRCDDECYAERLEAKRRIDEELVAAEYVESDSLNTVECESDNDECCAEGLKVNRQIDEELVPDEYDNQSCSECDTEDELEEVAADEEVDDLDDESEVTLLQREFQMAMLRKRRQNYDVDNETIDDETIEDETIDDDDDSDGSIDELESDAGTSEVYQFEEQVENVDEA